MNVFKLIVSVSFGITLLLGYNTVSHARDICEGYGPQTPRDISSKTGTNPLNFSLAPVSTDLNLCNIHTHTNAEHKGPGFTISAGTGEHGGFKCNETKQLTKSELVNPGHGNCHGIKPGDSIEVHWVHSSCNVAPGEGLGACLSPQCANPQLRVETQVFLVVNDKNAVNFEKFRYGGKSLKGFHQAKSLPDGTGDPIEFLGSTTGPKYTEKECSPLQVTWSVRPTCTKVDIKSLNKWCKSNPFKENHSHGVRRLVTAQKLLSIIK